MILCKASQTAISKAVCYKTKNEQLREKAVHFLLVAINCFYAGLPTVFCTITPLVLRHLAMCMMLREVRPVSERNSHLCGACGITTM